MDLQICAVCGTQFDTTSSLASCPICDDPRQYVPPTGPSFTTLRAMRAGGKYTNTFSQVPNNPYVTTICTTPKFGIGQRAFLIPTPSGNVLWDCISFLDEETIERVKNLGGISRIIISHPHYYSTSAEWAEAFGCQVYTSAKDAMWLQRRTDRHTLFTDAGAIPLNGYGIQVAVVGGHFPGSLVLCHEGRLYSADSVQVVPSGLYNKDRPRGTVSFAFMWSYPNMIPLPPNDVAGIWQSLRHLDFDDVHGAFTGLEVYGNAKNRVRESARIVISSMGGDEALLE